MGKTDENAHDVPDGTEASPHPGETAEQNNGEDGVQDLGGKPTGSQGSNGDGENGATLSRRERFRNWIKAKRESPTARVKFGLNSLILTAFLVVILDEAFGLGWLSALFTPEVILAFISLGFLVILPASVYYFTLPLPESAIGSDDQEAHKQFLERRETAREAYVRLKQKWMLLAYAFMILALIAAVYPFANDLRLDANEGEAFIEEVRRTLDSPIGVFRGCSADEDTAGKPLHCSGDASEPLGTGEGPRLSWVLQIGGHVTPFAPLSLAEGWEKQGKSIEEAGKRLDEARSQLVALADEFKTKRADLDGNADIGKQVEEMEAALEQKEAQIASLLSDLYERASVGDKFIRGDSGYYVNGGLIIPFYLVVLSLVGGAVSLTRRIPEYQKQAAPGYVGTEQAPALTPPMLREYLVFQVVQFISAPFLAMIAYYVLEPSTTPATVGLAFAAGFASETVLIWVRAVVDKLKPEPERSSATGSVAGTIEGFKGKSAPALEQETTVSIVGQAGLTPTFADEGRFTMDNVREGACALEVVHQPGGPETKRTWCGRIEIQADKTVSVVVELPPA